MNRNKQIKIAIVDDHLLLRKSLKCLLLSWGYCVELNVPNGKDFLGQLNPDNLPDICIIDIHMPEMNGYEVINELRSHWPDIKILVYSMRISTGIGSYLVQGSDSMVSKGEDVSVLRSKLEQLTGS